MKNSTKSITPAKTSLISDLKDLISRSKSIAVVDYRGLKVGQASDLRRQIKKAGGEMLVTKNTLFEIAAANKSLALSGTNAFIFSLTDEVTTLKALADFSKKNQLPTFKLGLLSEKVLTASEITELASLPDKPTLVAKMLGSLKSPIFSLVYNLNWNITNLVRTLDAVRQAKS